MEKSIINTAPIDDDLYEILKDFHEQTVIPFNIWHQQMLKIEHSKYHQNISEIKEQLDNLTESLCNFLCVLLAEDLKEKFIHLQ